MIRPDYNNSILNLITSILKYYNVESKYNSLPEIDEILKKDYNYDGTMFGKNDELVVGDKIYLTDLQKNTVEYEINSIFVTDPNDVSILETNEEEIREVTLITCENGNKARLIIKAEEVKK